MTQRRQKRREGDLILIPLGENLFGYGRVLREPLIAFYDCSTTNDAPPGKLTEFPTVFVIFVMNHSITRGRWRVIGHEPLSGELLKEPLFYKQNPITGQFSIYRDSTGEEVPATQQDCEKLELAAVWEPEEVEDRLRGHFSHQGM